MGTGMRMRLGPGRKAMVVGHRRCRRQMGRLPGAPLVLGTVQALERL